MMVGHGDVDAVFKQLSALLGRGDAGVDGDDEVGSARLQ